ncbi:MAG: 4Fe-4S binding protein [Desulfobacterales bacterium]|nr:4Fe-4S binding protein [Desulfobacterales bacterium]
MTYKITDACVGCGLCAKKCPENAIEGKIKVRFEIDPFLCMECGTCFQVCPRGAIVDPQGKASVPKGKKSKERKATIDATFCAGCRNCFMNCPQEAIAVHKKGFLSGVHCQVNKSACVGCGNCMEICITGAITLS